MMAEYRLLAHYGEQKLFQTPLYIDTKTHEQQEPDATIDPSGDSALYEREWYANWSVWDDDGVSYPLCGLSANGTMIDLHLPSSQPFLMQYGFVRFRAEIVDADGNRQILYSKFCSALNSADNENIEQMIRRITAIREPVLNMLRWPSRIVDADTTQPQHDSGCYSMINGLSSHSDTVNSPSTLSNIIEAYQRNAPYFRAKPEHTIRKNTVPVPFHRVRALSRDSMIWSVRTGNLHPLPPDYQNGIPIGDTRYMPRETLTETTVKDNHIYENLILIGFLDTVRRQLKNTEWMEQNNSDAMGFHILRMVLYPEAQHTSESLALIEDLRKQYQHSLRLAERNIPKVLSLPKQTKRFQEIPPYRDIYQRIYEWFCGGSTVDWGDGAIFKGRLADTIYEYFCWQELLHLFAQNGFQQYKPSIRTGYHGHRPKPPFSNIVFLRKEQTRVTLYFDPWIPTVRQGATPMYGISLVRTDTILPEKGYSPDFLIKVERGDESAYAILDAKFRDMARLFPQWKPLDSTLCAMEESLQKYYINLSAEDTLLRPIKMIWLLQGRCVPAEKMQDSYTIRTIQKGDPQAKLDYYPETFFQHLSWGAMPLHAQNTSEWANQFWTVFSATML